MTADKVAPQLLSAKEVAARLNVSYSHARHVLASGAMPTVRVMGCVRVTEEALARFIADNTHAAPRNRLRRIGAVS